MKTEAAITEAYIHKLIDESEFNVYQVDVGNIKNAIAELNDVLKPLQLNASGREIRYQVLTCRDAEINITIEDDKMTAIGEITTAQGGKHLTAKGILKAAQSAGVTKGFIKEELVALARMAAKEPPGSIVKNKIAEGKIAIDGKDGQIMQLVQNAQERLLKPKERSDGSVDMRDFGDLVCVRIGDKLAQKVPPTEGIKGYTVIGEPLEPTPGKDIDLKPGEGTVLSPKNDHVLLSNKVGLPRFTDNSVNVEEVYQIKNVDISTGNVKFDGTVIISGDVCEGMKVIASGDITVGGFVESAILTAGGDITIQGGIIGKKQDVENTKISDCSMSVAINAKGKIYAKYCQYAKVNSESDIRIENQLMHSQIDVLGQLWVGKQDKADGKLIGGSIHADSSVHAGIVGATAGSHTFIYFDRIVERIKQRLENTIIDMKALDAKAKEIQAAIKKLKAKKSPHELIDKLVKTFNFQSRQLAQKIEEKDKTEEELQQYMSSVFIEATEKLHQGVELNVGDFHDRSRRDYGPSRMLYKERKIIIDPIVHSNQ